MERSNVDTDQIIPKQFLKKVERSGFGKHLFHDWRFNSDGSDNADFALNNPAFSKAKILLVGDNFGCGSSREHAPWALADYGFNTIISSSYADIFYNNCFKNSILPIVASRQQLAVLMDEVRAKPGISFAVDLPAQQLSTPSGNGYTFAIDQFAKDKLIAGLDDIAATLMHTEAISQFESNHRRNFPWLWQNAQ